MAPSSMAGHTLPPSPYKERLTSSFEDGLSEKYIYIYTSSSLFFEVLSVLRKVVFS